MILLLDTGPLVALLRDTDPFHEWAKTNLGHLPGPFHTCDAVVTEACHLLQLAPGGRRRVLAMITEGSLLVESIFARDSTALVRLLDAYGPRMDLADACIVRLSELHPRSTVVTLDSDFTFYRRHSRERIPLLAPFAP
jgi:predicted nucleic acid-binding protein